MLDDSTTTKPKVYASDGSSIGQQQPQYVVPDRIGAKADSNAISNTKKPILLRRFLESRIAQKENTAYYQNHSEWHSERTDSERKRDRSG